jgi:hypothetical protein
MMRKSEGDWVWPSGGVSSLVVNIFLGIAGVNFTLMSNIGKTT